MEDTKNRKNSHIPYRFLQPKIEWCIYLVYF